MIKQLLMLAVTSGLAAKALKMWMERESTRNTGGAARADVQRWEDEGGNLPPSKPARKTTNRRTKAAAADAAPARSRTRRAGTTTTAGA